MVVIYVMFLLLIVRVRAKKNSVIVFLFVSSCLWFICKSSLNYDTETMFPVIMGLLFLLIVENKDRKKALVEMASGMKITFISQFLVGDEEIAEKRFKRDCAETKYRTLGEKINALKLQLRLNDSATVREWSRYDSD